MLTILLALTTALLLQCNAALHPGTPPPVIEDDGVSPVYWTIQRQQLPENVLPCVNKAKIQKLKAGESIQIQSPNYPDNYPTKKCEWKLKGDGIEKVKISCSKFKMEASNKKGKCRDFLKIGTEKYCGEKGPVDVTISVTNVATLLFKSNKNDFETGFSCTVTAPEDCKCGKKKVSTRIVNGQETDVLEYPWQAGLVSTGDTTTFCGGSLINSNWVLTAAHCTIWTASSPSAIQVLLAEHDVTVSESHTERFNIKRIINHANFDWDPWNGHDVALLELDGRVNFETSQARPICLPTGSSDYAGAEALVTGFGMTGAGQNQSNYLREVDIHVITTTQCLQELDGNLEGDYPTLICAGERDGTGGCMGDSGGPLITQVGNNYEQIGVVSFGSDYCDNYGVFARVTALITWITSYTDTGNPDICSR